MEGVLTGVIQTVLKRNKAEGGERKLIDEIDEVRQKLTAASARYEFLSDPDLVESCIYEMQSLTAKYRYLARKAKSQGLTRSASTTLLHSQHL